MVAPKKTFFMSPYLLFLSLICIVAVTLMTLRVTIPIIADYGYDYGNATVRGVLLVMIIPDLLLFFLLFRTYEAFGHMKIQENAVVFSHPFRGKRKLLFSEIKYVGIDYGVISGGVKQFWIYFSKVPIPPKYVHNMNRMALSKQTMRIQYRREVFESLIYYLPKDLSKRLRANYSIIRLYKKEE